MSKQDNQSFDVVYVVHSILKDSFGEIGVIVGVYESSDEAMRICHESENKGIAATVTASRFYKKLAN